MLHMKAQTNSLPNCGGFQTKDISEEFRIEISADRKAKWRSMNEKKAKEKARKKARKKTS